MEFYEGLSEEIRNNPTMDKFKEKGGDDLAKSYIELEKLISKKGLIKPTETSSQAEKDAFYAELGRPKTHDEYQFSNIENLPKELESLNTDESKGNFKKLAHSLNLSQEQADGLYKWYLSENTTKFNGMKETTEKAKAESVAKLKEEFGVDFDKNINLAKEAAKKMGIEGMDDLIGVDPKITKMLTETGKLMADDDFDPNKAGTGKSIRSQEVVQSEINAILAQTPDEPFYNRRHPEHQATVDKYRNLNVEHSQLEKKEDGDIFSKLNT